MRTRDEAVHGAAGFREQWGHEEGALVEAYVQELDVRMRLTCDSKS